MLTTVLPTSSFLVYIFLVFRLQTPSKEQLNMKQMMGELKVKQSSAKQEEKEVR